MLTYKQEQHPVAAAKDNQETPFEPVRGQSTDVHMNGF